MSGAKHDRPDVAPHVTPEDIASEKRHIERHGLVVYVKGGKLRVDVPPDSILDDIDIRVLRALTVTAGEYAEAYGEAHEKLERYWKRTRRAK